MIPIEAVRPGRARDDSDSVPNTIKEESMGWKTNAKPESKLVMLHP